MFWIFSALVVLCKVVFIVYLVFLWKVVLVVLDVLDLVSLSFFSCSGSLRFWLWNNSAWSSSCDCSCR
ncbi:hypothetical protein BCR32DRAFT_279740 [Anaeromyces robustus]|uniref:Uncharacterized protein n=1 Tax=Anaeromyces robustus TaxID=1754192 RepID=A0A1Y1X6M4_9FUNG|nr:hypothetical protein BCR32DRAFT_279740 [Anaeromyces robustus]|eukprot:ORX81439.1 hypothetical protein BCR32DRAFT_279740 [Anaeromyces robustus]